MYNVESNICIANTMLGFGPLVKIFNGKYLVNRISVGTKIITINKSYVFSPPDLAPSTQSHNTRSSTYINKNNNDLYRVLIQP